MVEERRRREFVKWFKDHVEEGSDHSCLKAVLHGAAADAVNAVAPLNVARVCDARLETIL